MSFGLIHLGCYSSDKVDDKTFVVATYDDVKDWVADAGDGKKKEKYEQREFGGQNKGSQTTLIIAFSVFIVMAFTGLALALFFVPGPSEEVEAFHSPHVDEKAINKALAKAMDKATTEAVDDPVDDPVDDLVDKALAEAKSAVAGLEVKPSPPKAEAELVPPATKGLPNAPNAPGKLATGSACKFNFKCQSNKCVKGRCIEGDFGDPCKYGFHCKDRKCVKGRCIEGNIGDPCKYSFHCKDRKCVSGRCIEGVSGDPCKYSFQCKSRRCKGKRCE